MNNKIRHAGGARYLLRSLKISIFGLCLSIILSGFATIPASAESIVSSPNVISAGEKISFSIMSDGTLWMWGQGNNLKTIRPVMVMRDVRSVSGSSGLCAVIKNDNSLWYAKVDAQGDPVFGEPVKIADDVLSCAGRTYIQTDHILRSAIEENGNWRSRFIEEDVVSWTGVTHGFYGSGYAVVRTDGSLWMWGIGDYGDGGGPNAHEENYMTRVKIMDDVISVIGGNDAYAVIKKDHSLWAWGKNNWGQIGNGTTDYAYYPTKIMDDVLTARLGSACAAIKMDGSLWMWGSSSLYNVGNGLGSNKDYFDPTIMQLTPVKVLDNVVDVSCGASYTLAVKTDGSLWAWGQNFNSFGDDSIGDISPSGDPDLRRPEWKYQSVPIQIRDGVMVPEVVKNAASIHVNVNGKDTVWTDAAPFIDENGRTMVPLRAVGDALGLMVDWDNTSREAIFTNGTKTIYFPIGSTMAYTSDGQSIQMDTTAIIVNDRTYAPVRYLAEFFGFTVGWNNETRTVIIG